MSPPVSRRELLAILLSERLHDGELMVIGGASVIPMAAARLAQLTHAPNLTILTGSGAINPRPDHLSPSGGDWEYLRTAEAFFTIEDIFDDTERARYDVAIFGGLQIDAFGNFNLTYVGGSLEQPRLRGPGFVNAGIAYAASRYMLCTERHTPQVMVERVDFASGAGSRRPDGTRYPSSRRGGGPEFCVTPLGCFEPDAEGRLSLISRHPGVSSEELVIQTGFPVTASEQLPLTPPPRADLVDLLRRQIDPTGALRTPGADRQPAMPSGQTLPDASTKTEQREEQPCQPPKH